MSMKFKSIKFFLTALLAFSLGLTSVFAKGAFFDLLASRGGQELGRFLNQTVKMAGSEIGPEKKMIQDAMTALTDTANPSLEQLKASLNVIKRGGNSSEKAAVDRILAALDNKNEVSEADYFKLTDDLLVLTIQHTKAMGVCARCVLGPQAFSRGRTVALRRQYRSPKLREAVEAISAFKPAELQVHVRNLISRNSKISGSVNFRGGKLKPQHIDTLGLFLSMLESGNGVRVYQKYAEAVAGFAGGDINKVLDSKFYMAFAQGQTQKEMEAMTEILNEATAIAKRDGISNDAAYEQVLRRKGQEKNLTNDEVDQLIRCTSK